MRLLRPAIFTALFILLAVTCKPNGNDKPVDDHNSGKSGETVGSPLSAWQEGCLDIHFINTTAGECTFIIFPDGTQMLVDAAGARTRTGTGSVTNVEIRRRWDPLVAGNDYNYGAFIADYIKKCMQWTKNYTLDYAMLSHFHNDHFGGKGDVPVSDLSPTYTQQSFAYLLDYFGADKLIDRGWPNYDYPFDVTSSKLNTGNAENVQNYVAAVKWHVANRGMKAEKFKAGVTSQIKLVKDPDAYPECYVQNLAVNGEVWTGSGSETKMLFPEKALIRGNGSAGSDYCPNENGTSIAFRLSYGKFDLFMGGDLTYVGYSSYAWKDIETPVAKACGKVEVMKANHHSCHNTNGVDSAKGHDALTYLQPQTWIINTWADTQPHVPTMVSASNALPLMDIFVTNLTKTALEEAGAVVASRIQGYNGHVVVRVNKGGDSYNVYTLSDYDKTMTVQTISGPYKCK